MVAVLVIGGFFRSLQFTSINTIAYAEVDNARINRATALVSVGQQLSLSAGVAVGALAVQLTVELHSGGGGAEAALRAIDFPPAFLAVAAISAIAALVFIRLPADAGAELANRGPISAETVAESSGPRAS
jgi:hypothetical protein